MSFGREYISFELLEHRLEGSSRRCRACFSGSCSRTFLSLLVPFEAESRALNAGDESVLSSLDNEPCRAVRSLLRSAGEARGPTDVEVSVSGRRQRMDLTFSL